MSERFFSNKPIQTDQVVLDGDQAHHIRNVMRMQVGDDIVLFDGSGAEFESEITSVGRREIAVAIKRRVERSRELDVSITIAAALPKVDRLKFLVEKLVELGVERLVPLRTIRSVAKVNDKTIQRMEKQVVEASKQCGRNRLMRIVPVMSLPELVHLPMEGTRLIASPQASNDIKESIDSNGRQYTVAIGPEGGFTSNEIEQATECDWRPFKLGPAILRIETAAIASATLLRQY